MARVYLSRIAPPALHRVFERPRLTELLRKHEHIRIIVILGQAAQGKSTLAACFVRSCPVSVAWINVFPEDEEPVNLFHGIVQGLSPVLGEGAVRSLLHYPGQQMGPREREPLYRDWLLALFAELDRPVRIVIDGLDRLAAEAPSFLFLRLMLEEAPDNVRFLIVSRKEPLLPLQDWKMKQQAFVLTNSDLAFTYKEVKGFLRELCGWGGSLEEARRVWQATEGWTGGLVLLAQGLLISDREAGERCIPEALPKRFQAEVFRYFAEEIFSGLSRRDAWFLLHSSVFEEVHPQILDELLEEEGSEVLLQDLERRNLFVHAVRVASGAGVYRYHLLFRNFLQEMWKRRFGPQERRRFLSRAASACARRGDLETAAGLFLQAGVFARAAAVLKILGRRMLRAGRSKDLAGILDRFPERLVRTRPWLLCYRVCCRRYTHAAENVDDLDRSEALFRKSGDMQGRLLARSYLLEAIMLRGRDRVPMLELLADSQELLRPLDQARYPLEQALLWLQMGFCYALRGENARDGYRAGLNAYFLARKAQDLPLQVHALLVAMLPMTYVGEFSEAEEMRSRAEGLLHKVVNRELHAVFLKNWSELALFRGRLETAGGLVRQMNEEIDRLGLLYFQVPGMYSELLYHIYAGNEAETEEIGRRLLDMSRSMDHSFSSGLCSILLAMHAYRQRQWSRARELVSAGKEIFSMPDTISPFHYHEACLLAGLVHLHLENPDMAEKLFRSALRYALRVSNHLIRVETLLSLALLMENSSRFREACAYLESGFSIASNRNYTHFMIIGPLDQIMVCALALRAGTRSSAQYADHLLRAGLIEAAQPQELRGLQNHPSPEVRRSAQTAMLERHRRNRPVLSIETLGGFRVWSGQRPLSEEEWQGNQAKTLLKALVSQTRQGKAHKGLLIDELWPDSDPGAGEKTFKAALHRLRRSLEPDMDPGFGSSYIHLKSGRAFLDRELCRIDTERFLELASHAEDQLGSGEWRPALKTYEQALALYKGDFLPADPDRDWTMGMRELLRQRHINVLLEAGRGFERCGSKGKAARLYERALECEPLLEEACRRLMVLHADQGRRSKALQVYARCCETLRDSLGIEPDPLTTSLYRRIRG